MLTVIMLHFGTTFSVSYNVKTLAANTAATASKKAASAGKQSNKVADTSCHHLSKRDLSYFSSEKFEKSFERYMKFSKDRALALQFGELIASRKRCNNLSKAWNLIDAVIYGDMFEAHYDGFKYTFEEVRDLFKGYRSQALREASKTTGFNKLFYKEFAKTMLQKEEIRSFLKALNTPKVTL